MKLNSIVIKLKDGKLVDSEDISDRILLHYSDKHEPLEIEILDASKVACLNDMNISWKEMLPDNRVAA